MAPAQCRRFRANSRIGWLAGLGKPVSAAVSSSTRTSRPGLAEENAPPERGKAAPHEPESEGRFETLEVLLFLGQMP
jgi:hypothetical protein